MRGRALPFGVHGTTHWVYYYAFEIPFCKILISGLVELSLGFREALLTLGAVFELGHVSRVR